MSTHAQKLRTMLGTAAIAAIVLGVVVLAIFMHS